MKPHNAPPRTNTPRLLGMPLPLALPALYLLFGVLWIPASDLALETMVSSEAQLRILSMLKGWFFIVLSALVLYLVLILNNRKTQTQQQQLAKSEAHLKLAQSTARVGSWEQDGLTDELTWSDTVYELFGVDAKKTTPSVELFFEMVHPDDREQVGEAFQNAMKPDRPPYDIIHRTIRADTGAVRFIHEYCTHVRDAEGNLIKSVGTVQDITEQVESEERVKTSETLLRRTEAMAHVGSWQLDLKTNVLTWSDEAYRVFGVPPEKFNGTYEAFLETVHPDDHEKVNDAYAGSIRDGRDEYEIEHRVVWPDGSVRHVHEKCAHERNAEGTIIRSIGFTHDITDRKKQDIELQQSRKMLQDVVNTNPDLMWLKDEDGIYLNCNPRFAQLFGADAETIIGQTDYDFVDTELADFFREHDRAAIDNKGPIRNEERLTFASDGHLELLETIKTPMYGKDGKLIGVLGIGREITERRQAATELKQSRKLLDDVINAMPDMLWMKDINGAFLTCNREFEKLAGLSRAELAGTTDYDHFNKEQADICCEQDRAAMENGVQSTHIEPMAHATMGCDVWFEVIKTPVCDNEGQPLGVLGVGRDITERKQAEQALADSEEKYRALFNNAPLPYQSLNEDGCFMDVNPAWLRTLGYERDEVIGNWFGDFLHPDFVQHFETNFPAFKKRGYVKDVQFRIRHKDGTYRHIEFEGCIGYLPDGSFRQTYCVFQDITERKAAEEALKEKEQRYRGLIELTGDAMVMHDPSGRIIDVNDFACATFGYTREEFLQMIITDIDPDADDRNDTDTFWNNELYHPLTFETRQKKKNGDIFQAEVRHSMVRHNGATVGLGFSRDITEKKQAEQKLRDSEERFNIAVDAAAIGIWELDLRTEQLIWDDRMFPLYGILPNDFSGAYEAWHSGLHPEDRQRAMDETTAAISGEKEYDTEFRIIRPDGETRHIRAYGQVIRAEDGTPLRMIGTNHDITEQHEAQESLRESETRLRAILDATPFPIALVDVNDDKVDFWSRSAHSLFGQTAPTAAEWFQLAYPDPEYQRQVVEQWKPALESARASDRAVNTGEYRITCEDGSIRICELFVMFLPDRLVITFNDITSRKESEAELSASEERFRTICELAPVLIDGFDETGRCTLWNEQCRKTFGWTFEEVAAHPNALELFYPDPDVRDEVQKSITINPDGLFREWQTCTKDGQVLTTVWANLLLPDGQAYSVGQDITENRRLEQELADHSADLEHEVDERTYELRQIVNAMAGRENRMAELKEAMASLHAQLREAGIEPICADSEGTII